MTPLRLLRDEGRGARGNVALTAAMMELHALGRIPDTLRLYRYPKSVLLGRNQNAADAADLAQCSTRGIEIARRITGGGAVYMDSGVLTWDLVLSRRAAGNDPRQFSEKICSAIAKHLSSFGVEAQFAGDNAVEVSGRKLLGASGCFEGATFVYQGSLLVSPDLDAMSAALRFPPQALACRVTTLEQAANRKVTAGKATELLVRPITTALGREAVTGEVTPEEHAMQESLFAEEYGRDDFVLPGHQRAAA